MAISEKVFVDLLKAALEFGASDLHIREDEPPLFRVNGDLHPIKSLPVKHSDVESICRILMNSDEPVDLDEIYQYDGGQNFPDICRTRFNFFRFQGKVAIIIRLIKTDIPDIKSLNLPSSLKKIAARKHGLILITGATGSGKSSTMAAIINYINTHRRCHILTIEDPVEYLHEQQKARITQREIGIDTQDFENALRGALRQDPDVIAIGEMRDPLTADICMRAAETGHLVISTVHTSNAENTIGRIIAMFPAEAQGDIRQRFADNIVATISQRLLKHTDGKTSVPAIEIMVSSPGIRACISGNEEMTNLYTYIREGYGPGGNGSQTFEQHLKYLIRKGYISKEVAIDASNEDFAKLLDLTD